jgi:hypothetical protein
LICTISKLVMTNGKWFWLQQHYIPIAIGSSGAGALSYKQ